MGGWGVRGSEFTGKSWTAVVRWGPLFYPGSRVKLAITSSSPPPIPFNAHCTTISVSLYHSPCQRMCTFAGNLKKEIRKITSPIAQYKCLLFSVWWSSQYFTMDHFVHNVMLPPHQSQAAQIKSITCLWRASRRRWWLRWEVRKDQGGGRDTSSALAVLGFEGSNVNR